MRSSKLGLELLAFAILGLSAACGGPEMPAIGTDEEASKYRDGCATCHGSPPRSGQHGEHGFSCQVCHAGYTKNSVKSPDHMNGKADVSLRAWDPHTRTCAKACHGTRMWGDAPTPTTTPAPTPTPTTTPVPTTTPTTTPVPTPTTTPVPTPTPSPIPLTPRPGCASKATGCHDLPPDTMFAVVGQPPHTTLTTCGTCHPIGDQIPGTTTFDMQGVPTHQNGVPNVRGDLPTADCVACHGLPPPPLPPPSMFTPVAPFTGNHPAAAQNPYVASCGACHPVGPLTGSTFGSMPSDTHVNGVLDFNP